MDAVLATGPPRGSRAHLLSAGVSVLCGLKTCLLLVCAVDVATQQWRMNNTNVSSTAGPLSIADVCPGVEHLISQHDTNSTLLQVSVSDCENDLPDYTAQQGAVYGLCQDITSFCKLHVEVTEGMYVRAHVDRTEYWCDSRHWTTFLDHTEAVHRAPIFSVQCNRHNLSEMFVDFKDRMLMAHFNGPAITVDIESTEDGDFVVKYVSEYSGYITAPFGETYAYLGVEWKAPPECFLMVSIQQFPGLDIGGRYQYCRFIQLGYTKVNSAHQTVERVCIDRPTPAMLLHTSNLTVIHYRCETYGGAKIAVSALSVNHQHIHLASGFFNCSVNHYSEVEEHLHCNLHTECQDGRDETEQCSFSSADCQGLVATRNKCFILLSFDHTLLSSFSMYECMKIGGRIASVRTRNEQKDFLRVVENYSGFKLYMGRTSGWVGVPFMYSMFRKWSDDALVYNLAHFSQAAAYLPSRSLFVMLVHSMVLFHVYYYHARTILCETELQSHHALHSLLSPAYVHSPTPSFSYTNQSLHVCPDRHSTHVFLPCDSRCIEASCTTATNVSDAQQADSVHLERRFTQSYAMFRCDDDDDVRTLHHTVVCDFIQDCPDGSDESFCQHPSCSGFLCDNGQCVTVSQRCSQCSDCLDDSDEVGCAKRGDWVETKQVKQQRFYVSLDGGGYFTQQLMSAEDRCPPSHYRCTAEWLYCLPSYTRCNGLSDCVYGEDEQDCETMTCPGFYRCRASTVCVHGHHLCDGWGQCPQRDDELMCDMTCPAGCLCQGHAFLCSIPFQPDRFPHLRYVDATGAHLSLGDFNENAYLVRLTLSHCSLTNASRTRLLNLRYIDLAENYLRTLDMAVVLGFPNLRILQLENNPHLSKMTSMGSKHIHYALRRMDVSKTHLNVLHNAPSLFVPYVYALNVSSCAIRNIGLAGFKSMPQLKELDISGNAVNDFPFDLFSSSCHLDRISSSNHRLCCPGLLPTHAGTTSCVAPRPVFPSCSALIPSELYRAFFWLMAASATIANLLCLAASSAVTKVVGGHFVMSVAHLQFANVCMGTHVSIILAADYINQGEYIQWEKAWTTSVACKLAGFLSLLSSAVSVLVIAFITLYHVIALDVSQRLRTFTTSLTVTPYIVLWVVGIVLASIPFLPGLSHWGLQGQSGLCRLALVHGSHPRQGFRWFTVIVALNFVLCLMIVANQTVIYRRTPKYRITLHPTQRPVYSSVHVMGTVSVTEAACWLLLGLVTMMSCVGDFVKLHDTLAVLVLPLSAALHPLLYVSTVRTQGQRQGQEEKLLHVLKSQLAQTENKY